MPTPITLSSPDITQREIDAVVDVLHGNTLSIGPKIEEFERACAKVAGRKHGIGVSSGTAGLHCAMIASGIGAGDEVITSGLDQIHPKGLPLATIKSVGPQGELFKLVLARPRVDLSRLEEVLVLTAPAADRPEPAEVPTVAPAATPNTPSAALPSQ